MISVIIPTKNRPELLSTCVKSVTDAFIGFNFEIIIINDSNHPIVLTQKILNLSILKNLGNGVASARNLGAKMAKGDWLLFLDDDMLISSENINHSIEFVQKTPNSCVNINWEYPKHLKVQIRKNQFGRFLEFYGFTSFRSWSGSKIWNDIKPFEIKTVTSQFLLISKHLFGLIEGYTEGFPHAGFEDYALAHTLEQNKIKVTIIPYTTAYHNEVDRIRILPWLERRKRGGETRKVAVDLGYKELTIHFSKMKSIIYRFIYFFRYGFYILLFLIPNIRIFDRLFFLLVNALYGAYSYAGYKLKR